jgi:conjugal transfer pilus assembly protein TraK
MLSNRFSNRITTPFVAPRVIEKSAATIMQDGSNIFVSVKGTDPIVIYITGDEAGDPVISLTIIPTDIPAQTVVLQLDIPSTARNQKTESYTQQIVDLLRQIGSGKTPEGYSEGRMPSFVGLAGQLNIKPAKRFSGSWMDIYHYVLQNDGTEVIELSETAFYKKGVRAVSIYPNLRVAPGEYTNIYVLADKSALDGAKNGVR